MQPLGISLTFSPYFSMTFPSMPILPKSFTITTTFLCLRLVISSMVESTTVVFPEPKKPEIRSKSIGTASAVEQCHQDDSI
jgi:hypothetical protein